MAEVIHVFDTQVVLNGVGYSAQVVGRQADHLWEGWIEFVSEDRADLRRTRRETTQPNRDALAYWATGLSGTYLEGALVRAMEPPLVHPPHTVSTPYFQAPAPNAEVEPSTTDRAILDPFSVGAKGEDLLRQELGALRGWHLRNIVRAYDLADRGIDLESLAEPELVELIVTRVAPA